MKLCPHELDKLQIYSVSSVAQKRLARGIRLNVPETVAIISNCILELARDGTFTVAQLMDLGRKLIGLKNVMPGVQHIVDEVQIEANFRDGTKLVTLHNPICQEYGDISLCLSGSGLPIPPNNAFADSELDGLIPGVIHTLPGSILLNENRPLSAIKVMNCSDRPIQVGSHYHFIETNPYLCFDRRASYGKRLNIPAGTAVRFEPGEVRTVTLVDIGGNKIIRGGNNLCNGPVDTTKLNDIFQLLLSKSFMDSTTLPVTVSTGSSEIHMNKRQRIDSNQMQKIHKELQLNSKEYKLEPYTVTRDLYNRMFGPTTGDIIRLADTELYIRVEYDMTVYGDECKFGGGKTLREGMGNATGVPVEQQLDTVITNALIVDYTGIYKADIGIKNGRIHGIGKSGNPDTMNHVSTNIIVGVNTEVIAGEGLIVTAGGIDTHIHYICPQLCEEAICSGLTTLLGGGTGPASGSCATTCTPSPNHMKMMLQATDILPLNIGFTGRGNTSSSIGLIEIIEAGAVGLKLHEDCGTTPSAIDTCLTVADAEDIQVTIHTDTLNESCCVEGTLEAIKGRTIHTYHSEGAGGGHAPDIITVCSHPNVIPSSTNPTKPLTINTIDEHLDMLMVCHHLDKNIPEDIAFAESRIRMETIAAEDILHDMGAISIISSDSQAMGRVGEVITRTWQTADKMKKQRGQLKEDQVADLQHPPNPTPYQCHNKELLSQPIQTDNFRVKRYIAKYTINPALAHGFGDIIGSIEIGKLADLIIWHPAYFGAKPEMIIKGGYIAYSQMGDANASIPTPQPYIMRKMYGSMGLAASQSSIAFVSQRSINSGKVYTYGLNKQIIAVKQTRSVNKKDMKYNDITPHITVDPETYRVEADGIHLTCEPLSSLPLTQLYFLY